MGRRGQRERRRPGRRKGGAREAGEGRERRDGCGGETGAGSWFRVAVLFQRGFAGWRVGEGEMLGSGLCQRAGRLEEERVGESRSGS